MIDYASAGEPGRVRRERATSSRAPLRTEVALPEEWVDRIVEKATGRLRPAHDIVIAEGSICDRYVGCADRMFLLPGSGR
jgi:hypothetical protein